MSSVITARSYPIVSDARTLQSVENKVDTEKVATVAKEVFAQKQANFATADANLAEKYPKALVGGDVFTSMYLILSGLSRFSKVMQIIPMLSTALTICGVIGGAINIGVAAVCFKESMKAFGNKAYFQGVKLMIDTLLLGAIGAFMMIVPIASKIGLGALSTFIAANPFVLPVLFFVLMAPTMIELVMRMKDRYQHNNVGDLLGLDEITTQIEKKEFNAEKWLQDHIQLQTFSRGNEREIVEHVSGILENYAEKTGVEAAIPAFNLIQHILEMAAKDKEIKKEEYEKLLAEVDNVKKEIKKWDRTINLRVFQQCLYIFTTIASLVGVLPMFRTEGFRAMVDFVMGAANVLPTYLDLKFPYQRNTPYIVKSVDIDEVVAALKVPKTMRSSKDAA